MICKRSKWYLEEEFDNWEIKENYYDFKHSSKEILTFHIYTLLID